MFIFDVVHFLSFLLFVFCATLFGATRFGSGQQRSWLQDAVSTIINISDVAIGAVVSIYFHFGAGSARRSYIKPTDELFNDHFHDHVGNFWPTSLRSFDCSLSICFVTAACFHDVACLSLDLSSWCRPHT